MESISTWDVVFGILLALGGCLIGRYGRHQAMIEQELRILASLEVGQSICISRDNPSWHTSLHISKFLHDGDDDFDGEEADETPPYLRSPSPVEMN